MVLLKFNPNVYVSKKAVYICVSWFSMVLNINQLTSVALSCVVRVCVDSVHDSLLDVKMCCVRVLHEDPARCNTL